MYDSMYTDKERRKEMNKIYFVSGTFIIYGYVDAESFEEAANKFISLTDGDVDGEVCVTNIDTGEEKMC